MPQLSITLTENQLAFLRQQAETNDISIGGFVRNLIQSDIANNQQQTNTDLRNFQEGQMKIYQATIESLYLTRHIALMLESKSGNKLPEDAKAILSEAKQKALVFVTNQFQYND